MIIQVFGPGCAKCDQVKENVTEAVNDLGLDAEIVKITDFNEMMKYGVMMTPALAIDGNVQCVGKVPTVDEIKTMLS